MPVWLHWPAISPFGRAQPHSSFPARSSAIDACWAVSGRSQDRRRGVASLTAVHTARRVSTLWMIIRYVAGLLAAATPSTGSGEAASGMPALLPSILRPVPAYAAFITEASHRFAIPERWIRAVMQIESGGNAHAISPRGALGLMQIMPKAWVELSARYELGIDPFDPHDNILAGTAYLREMLDRFGSEVFLAAYNVGPTRYEQHLAAGRPLADETQAYVAELAALIGIERRKRDISVVRPIVEWQQSAMFVEHSDGSLADGPPASAKHLISSSNAVPKAGASSLVPLATRLFVSRSDEEKSP